MSIIIIFNINNILYFVDQSLGRGSQSLAESNQTRMGLYNFVFEQLKSDFRMIFIGKGGGYIERTIENSFGLSYYLPVHQDFLMILSEYGLIGLLSVLYAFLKGKRTKWLFIYLFIACSFHNIVLSSKIMVLMTIALQNIENENDKIFISN